MSQSAYSLLGQRRFWPLFWAQALGAFNDNFLKNAMVILVVFNGMTVWGLGGAALATLAPAVFILPYFLFSASAGQLADRLPKSRLVATVKAVEVGIALVGAAGFLLRLPELLLVVLFGLGVQATFFGPLKYGILPELLEIDELVAGNALVESCTNLAILFGTIAGGLAIAVPGWGPALVSAVVVAVALLGWAAARCLPFTPAAEPALRVNWNLVSATVRLCGEVASQRYIWRAVLAISWFWLFGSCFLSLLIPYAKDVLGAGEHVVTLFLGVFSVGVGLGSLACERLSYGRLELGLVPIGSIGMSLFACDLLWAHGAGAPSLEPLGLQAFLGQPGAWRILVDLLGVSMASGFFIVPLYSYILARSNKHERGRVVAVNNVVNAAMMVAWAVAQVGLLKALSVPQIFAVVALLNAIVAAYIYSVIPEFMLRFLAYCLARLMYRLRVSGLDQVPEDGPALLVCNHVSFIDWLIIAAAIKRPVRFVMHHAFMGLPLAGPIFRQAKVIPIASEKEDPAILHAALERVAEELAEGNLVCIFPEGRLTEDGAMNPFKPGVERIVARTPVPVVPMGLSGLWGSFFSKKDGGAMRHPFRRFHARIDLTIGQAVPPEAVSAEDLQHRVAALRGEVA